MKSRVLKTVVTGLVILAAFLLQNNFFASVSLISITPNLMLIVTVSYGLLCGKLTGMGVGFCAGILMDMFGGTLLGQYALILSVLGYACGYFTPYFYPDYVMLPMAVCLVCDLIYGLYMYVFGFLIHGRLNILFYLRTIILPEAIYTAIVLIIVYRFLLLLNRSLDRTFQRGNNDELV